MLKKVSFKSLQWHMLPWVYFISDECHDGVDRWSILSVLIVVITGGFYCLRLSNIMLKKYFGRDWILDMQSKLQEHRRVKNELSLRTIGTEWSIGSGQGFVKCLHRMKCQSSKSSWVERRNFSSSQSVIYVCVKEKIQILKLCLQYQLKSTLAIKANVWNHMT